MNVFYEDLPVTLQINGEPYPIITDFREWIRFSDMIKSDIPPEYKLEFLSEMFLKRINVQEHFDEIIYKISAFLSLEELKIPHKDGGKHKAGKNTLSYVYDAPYIISAFLENYGVDLVSIDYMHWWKFRMLLDGLPDETHIKQRIYYRSVDLGDIKDKDEKKRISRIKKSIDLPENEFLSDEEIANAF